MHSPPPPTVLRLVVLFRVAVSTYFNAALALPSPSWMTMTKQLKWIADSSQAVVIAWRWSKYTPNIKMIVILSCCETYVDWCAGCFASLVWESVRVWWGVSCGWRQRSAADDLWCEFPLAEGFKICGLPYTREPWILNIIFYIMTVQLSFPLIVHTRTVRARTGKYATAQHYRYQYRA